MKRLLYLFAAMSTMTTIASTAMPQQVSAEPSTTVTVTQTILPPSCYDQVMVTEHSTDYIAVFNCDVQRD